MIRRWVVAPLGLLFVASGSLWLSLAVASAFGAQTFLGQPIGSPAAHVFHGLIQVSCGAYIFYVARSED